MISNDEASCTFEYPEYYKILPQINQWDCDINRIKNGVQVGTDFCYSSDANSDWMYSDDLKTWITKNLQVIGRI